MRQNHGDLLSQCVSENVCTELWYDEKVRYLDISDDMRPWSAEDVGDVNNWDISTRHGVLVAVPELLGR